MTNPASAAFDAYIAATVTMMSYDKVVAINYENSP